MEKELYKPGSIGRKIERIRKMKGMNQEALANSIGMTRQTLSKLEQSDEIEDDKLEQIAKALGVNAETIKNFNEDAVINYIQHNYDNAAAPNIFGSNNHLYSGEQLIQVVDENRKLYERLLQAEREKVEILQKLLDKK